jgi:hypothetical protein
MRYETFESERGNSIIRYNDDESVTIIPMDESNSDYQAYLNKDKAEQSTPSVAGDVNAD